MSFAKIKENMLKMLNAEIVFVIIAIILSLIAMAINSQFDLKTIIVIAVECGVVLVLLYAAKNMTQKGSIYGGVLALIAGIACLFISILTFIMGIVLIITAIVFLIKFNKK